MLSEKRLIVHRGLRALLISASIVALLSLPAELATAEHTDAAAERAAREVLDARDRANAAAQAMFDAESRLDTLTIELAAAERDLLELEAEVNALRSGLADSAVRQFVGAGQDPLMLFTNVDNSNDEATALIFFGAATGSELVRADEYDEAIDRLDAARHDLEARQAETSDARDSFANLEASAQAEVIELQQIEQERLQDAAVQHELERQRQARLEQERKEREEEQRQAASAQAAAQSSAASSGASSDSSTSGSTGNSSSAGASSGGSSSAPRPAPEPPPVNAGSGMACPVAGPRAFADTWGAPRSGGRRHEGVDMMAPGGTQLVAAESGNATFKTNRLGGNAVWLTGRSGTKYYYAHLSSWEGSSRSVSKGEVIGYVGATGNTSVNHLHFEVHPGGGAAVNPYPYVRAAC